MFRLYRCAGSSWSALVAKANTYLISMYLILNLKKSLNRSVEKLKVGAGKHLLEYNFAVRLNFIHVFIP